MFVVVLEQEGLSGYQWQSGADRLFPVEQERRRRSASITSTFGKFTSGLLLLSLEALNANFKSTLVLAIQ